MGDLAVVKNMRYLKQNSHRDRQRKVAKSLTWGGAVDFEWGILGGVPKNGPTQTQPMQGNLAGKNATLEYVSIVVE